MSEGLVAVRALMRLFASVAHAVLLHVARIAKLFAAKLALERRLTTVHVQVVAHHSTRLKQQEQILKLKLD